MKRTVSIEQASCTLEQWIQAASRGETVLITRGGRPVAALVSPPEPDVEEAVMAGMDPGLLSMLGWEDAEEVLRFLGE